MKDIKQNADKFQKHVYFFADHIAKKYGVQSILDIGCGYPKKIEMFLSYIPDIVGIDKIDIIEQCDDIPFGQWIAADIEKDRINLNRTFDLIIAADIIEHLGSPDCIFDIIKRHAHKDTWILFSTPEAETTLKYQGKPANSQHKREWTKEAFIKYIQENGFDVEESRLAIETKGSYPYVSNCFLAKISSQKTIKSKVLVSIPNVHWIHTTVVRAAMLLLQDRRYNVRIIMPAHKPYVNNLHHIVNDVVSGNYDFWLNIDADNPPTQNPLDLVALNKDIIGLPTPIWHFKSEGKGERPVYWNAYDYDSSVDAYREHQVREGLQRVDAVGTGCILIAGRVFKNKVMQKGAFMRKWNEDGTMDKGNDISFCERARNQGFEIYCHFGYPCDHFSEMSMNEMVRAFREMYEKEAVK